MKVIGANLTSAGFNVRLRLLDMEVERLTNEFEVSSLRNFRTRTGSVVETVAFHVVNIEAELTHTLMKALMQNICAQSSNGVYFPAAANVGLSTVNLVYRDELSGVYQLLNGYIGSVSFDLSTDTIPRARLTLYFPQDVTSSTFSSVTPEDFVHPANMTVSYYTGGSYTTFGASRFEFTIDNSVVCDRILDGSFVCFSESLRVTGSFEAVYPSTYSNVFENFYKNGTLFGLRLQYTKASTSFTVFFPNVVITGLDIFKDYGTVLVRFKAFYVASNNLIEFTST